jgi:hypothetical protein
MIGGLVVLALLAAQQEGLEPLVRDLESAELPKVYHAVAGLSELGEKAIPEIEARAKESKGRLRDYLQLAAEEIRAAQLLTGIPSPRRISIKSSDRNVIELLGELRTKTGLALALENLLGEEKMPEIPVDVRDATALEAFDAICKAGNVSILMDNGQIMLYQGDYQELPRFFYDHYFFRLGSFVVAKTADFRRPAVQSFRIQMEMLWNPAAAPCRFSAPVIVEAADDKGKSLLVPPDAPRRKDDPDEADEEPGAVSMLYLLPPSAGSEKIAVLRGFSTVALPRTRVTVSFGGEPSKKAETPSTVRKPAPARAEDPAPKGPEPPTPEPSTKPAPVQAEGLEGLVRKSDGFTIKVAKVEPALYRVTFEVSSSRMKPDDLSKLPFQATVVLKGGETTRCFLSPSANKDAAEVTVAFQPLHLQEALVQPGDDRPPPPPAIERIELSIVTAVQERKIPFEFRDVKLK